MRPRPENQSPDQGHAPILTEAQTAAHAALARDAELTAQAKDSEPADVLPSDPADTTTATTEAVDVEAINTPSPTLTAIDDAVIETPASALSNTGSAARRKPPVTIKPPVDLRSFSGDRSDLINVDADTDVSYSGIVHIRRSRQSKTTVTVTNTSVGEIDTPLILVVESISNPTVTVANADGNTTPDGRPFFDLSGQVPGDQLDPGESTGRRPLVFNNPLRRRFTITASVYRVQETPVTPAVSFEIETDPLGRTFIGAPTGIDVTIRAEGTTPVTIDLGQAAMASNSRGKVYFGSTGTETTATVTTSGGTDNIATIRARGDSDSPSAFQGDLNLTASVGGTEMMTKQVTVLKIALDNGALDLVNDIPVLRTINTIPAVAGLNFEFSFKHGRPTDGPATAAFALTDTAINILPVGARTDITTGADGRAQFYAQQGIAGQGLNWYDVRVVYSPTGPGADAGNDGTGTGRAQDCTTSTASSNDRGPNSVCLFSGDKAVDVVDQSIAGRGIDYQFRRTYRAQSSHLRTIATNDFGVDWAFS